MTLIFARDLCLPDFRMSILLSHHTTLQQSAMEDGSQAHAGEPSQPTTPPPEDNAETEQHSNSNTPRVAPREPVTELANQLEDQSISIQSNDSEPESEGELSSFDWYKLQSRFDCEMKAQTEEEHKIQEDLMQLMNVRHCLPRVHTEQASKLTFLVLLAMAESPSASRGGEMCQTVKLHVAAILDES